MRIEVTDIMKTTAQCSKSNYRVDVPLRTSHMAHLKASAEFLYVHTEQSHMPSSAFDRFALQKTGKK